MADKTNGVRDMPALEMMSDAEERFFHGLSIKVAELVAAEARAAGFGSRASSAGAMACFRAVAVTLWWSAPESIRSEAVLRSQLRLCADVATDNLMLEVRGSRRQ